MKVIVSTLMLLLVVTSGSMMTSCKKAKKTEKKLEELNATIKTGNWHISKFIDSGQDELSHFSGYTFVFGNDGILTANNGINVYVGTWEITASSLDDSEGNYHLNISFNYDNYFKDLTEDWTFLSHDDVQIVTQHISGGNGGTDYLTFNKY